MIIGEEQDYNTVGDNRGRTGLQYTAGRGPSLLAQGLGGGEGGVVGTGTVVQGLLYIL